MVAKIVADFLIRVELIDSYKPLIIIAPSDTMLSGENVRKYIPWKESNPQTSLSNSVFLCLETRSFNIRALSLFAGRWSLWVARERPFSRLCGFSLRAWAGQEPPHKHIAAIKGCFGNTSLTFARHPPNAFFSAAKVSQSYKKKGRFRHAGRFG